MKRSLCATRLYNLLSRVQYSEGAFLERWLGQDKWCWKLLPVYWEDKDTKGHMHVYNGLASKDAVNGPVTKDTAKTDLCM